MGRHLRDQTLIVDNTVENLGVAASWNKGIDVMDAHGVDWLVLVSAACRFGPAGGIDFLDRLDELGASAMSYDTDRNRAVAVEAGHGVGWHLIAFPRWTIEAVGRFDEIFWPAYCEDIDYSYRISRTFDLNPPYWLKTTDIDVSIAGFSHGVDLGKVTVDNDRNHFLYKQKWGGDKGQETFDTPYGEPGLSLTHTGGPPT
jgi:hypothetical protein